MAKQIFKHWKEFEEQMESIDRFEDAMVEEAIEDMKRMAHAMGRKYNPYKAVDSVSISERFAICEEMGGWEE